MHGSMAIDRFTKTGENREREDASARLSLMHRVQKTKGERVTPVTARLPTAAGQGDRAQEWPRNPVQAKAPLLILFCPS